VAIRAALVADRRSAATKGKHGQASGVGAYSWLCAAPIGPPPRSVTWANNQQRMRWFRFHYRRVVQCLEIRTPGPTLHLWSTQI